MQLMSSVVCMVTSLWRHLLWMSMQGVGRLRKLMQYFLIWNIRMSSYGMQ
uniref:Uncharacterized protein n=1 Tax=Arundo donax TaxID=35708 RepID=A0A0A9D7L9_ARUDO